MMKRIFAIILSVTMIVTFLPVFALADTFQTIGEILLVDFPTSADSAWLCKNDKTKMIFKDENNLVVGTDDSGSFNSNYAYDIDSTVTYDDEGFYVFETPDHGTIKFIMADSVLTSIMVESSDNYEGIYSSVTIGDILPNNFPTSDDDAWYNSEDDNVCVYKDDMDAKLVFDNTAFTDGVLISSILTKAEKDPSWSDTTTCRFVFSASDIDIQFNMTGDTCDELENIVVTRCSFSGVEGTYEPFECVLQTIENGTPESAKETNHGYITIDKTFATKGDTVTVDVTPNNGYQLKKLWYAPTPKTIASILPEGFPIAESEESGAPASAWKSVTLDQLCYVSFDRSQLLFYKETGDPDTSFGISMDTVLSADDSGNYVYTKDGIVTITFSMMGEGGALNSIDFANTENTTWNGIYQESACVAAGTMITLCNGEQKAVEDLKIGDIIRTFDHEKGEISSAPVCFIWESKNATNAFTLTFEDDIKVTVIEEHGFYSLEKKKYVFINAKNAANYIGTDFYNADTDSWLTLNSIELLPGYVDAYAIATSKHLNHLSNGMLSMCDGSFESIANLFEHDVPLKINANQKEKDIQENGGLTSLETVLTYRGFNEADYNDYNLQYINVAIGKGLITWEWIEALSEYCALKNIYDSFPASEILEKTEVPNGGDFEPTTPEDIEIIVDAQGRYLFTMPDYDVTVTAEFEEVPVHTHSFTYTANNGKITATCEDGCDDGFDENPLTLTLTAPENLAYDGNAKAFTFADGEADAWTGAGLELPTIIYYVKQSGQSTYMPLLGTLKSVGNYMAEITVNEKTAQVEFAIGKATPYIKTNPAPNDIEYGEKLFDSTLFGGYVQVSSTNTTQVAGLFEWTNSDTVPGLDDSEVTEYDVTFTPVDTDNFNTVSCKVKIKVNHTHAPVLVNGQAATETTAGWKDYYECVCGECYEDAAGSVLIRNFDEWKAEGGAGYIPPIESIEVVVDLRIGNKEFVGVKGGETIEVESLDDLQDITVLVQNDVDIEGMSDNWSMSTKFLDGEGRSVLEVQVFEQGDDYVTFNLQSHYADCPGADVEDFQIMLITAKLPIVEKMLGDANGDEIIDMKDVLTIRKYLADKKTEINLVNAECNEDGVIDMKDVLMLRQFLVGQVKKLGA